MATVRLYEDNAGHLYIWASHNLETDIVWTGAEHLPRGAWWADAAAALRGDIADWTLEIVTEGKRSGLDHPETREAAEATDTGGERSGGLTFWVSCDLGRAAQHYLGLDL